MIRKLSCLSVALVALGGLVIGCSDDSSRVTSPGGETQLDDLLSASTDEPGVIIDFEDYIAQGYYYPEDDASVDDGLGQDTNDDSSDDLPTNPKDNWIGR